MEATRVAGLDSGKVLGLLHTPERRATHVHSLQRQQQHLPVHTVPVCTKTAVALSAEGLGGLSDLIRDIFRRNGLPPVTISSPAYQPQETTQ